MPMLAQRPNTYVPLRDKVSSATTLPKIDIVPTVESFDAYLPQPRQWQSMTEQARWKNLRRHITFFLEWSELPDTEGKTADEWVRRDLFRHVIGRRDATLVRNWVLKVCGLKGELCSNGYWYWEKADSNGGGKEWHPKSLDCKAKTCHFCRSIAAEVNAYEAQQALQNLGATDIYEYSFESRAQASAFTKNLPRTGDHAVTVPTCWMGSKQYLVFATKHKPELNPLLHDDQGYQHMREAMTYPDLAISSHDRIGRSKSIIEEIKNIHREGDRKMAERRKVLDGDSGSDDEPGEAACATDQGTHEGHEDDVRRDKLGNPLAKDIYHVHNATFIDFMTKYSEAIPGMLKVPGFKDFIPDDHPVIVREEFHHILDGGTARQWQEILASKAKDPQDQWVLSAA